MARNVVVAPRERREATRILALGQAARSVNELAATLLQAGEIENRKKREKLALALNVGELYGGLANAPASARTAVANALYENNVLERNSLPLGNDGAPVFPESTEQMLKRLRAERIKYYEATGNKEMLDVALGLRQPPLTAEERDIRTQANNIALQRNQRLLDVANIKAQSARDVQAMKNQLEEIRIKSGPGAKTGLVAVRMENGHITFQQADNFDDSISLDQMEKLVNVDAKVWEAQVREAELAKKKLDFDAAKLEGRGLLNNPKFVQALNILSKDPYNKLAADIISYALSEHMTNAGYDFTPEELSQLAGEKGFFGFTSRKPQQAIMSALSRRSTQAPIITPSGAAEGAPTAGAPTTGLGKIDATEEALKGIDNLILQGIDAGMGSTDIVNHIVAELTRLGIAPADAKRVVSERMLDAAAQNVDKAVPK